MSGAEQVVHASQLQRMRQARTRRERNELARPPWANPQVCTADLSGWVTAGVRVEFDEADNRIVSSAPRLDGGHSYAGEAAHHKHCTCWCGKFRGAVAPTGEAV